jgi:hypothetical protein
MKEFFSVLRRQKLTPTEKNGPNRLQAKPNVAHSRNCTRCERSSEMFTKSVFLGAIRAKEQRRHHGRYVRSGWRTVTTGRTVTYAADAGAKHDVRMHRAKGDRSRGPATATQARIARRCANATASVNGSDNPSPL